MSQQSRPSIFRLPDLIKPAHRTPLSDMASGPVSPLERNPQPIKGWSIRESDGIGLGIVAALDRSDGCRRPEKIADGTPIKCVSAPISIGSPRDDGLWCNVRRCGGEASVNFHGPKDGGLFCWSPPGITDELRAFRPAEFLSQCCLCRKRLDGKDIYMYRGEKAFCSMECRCQQISTDEFQEKCGAEARRSPDVSRPSSENDHRLFFMGIAAS